MTFTQEFRADLKEAFCTKDLRWAMGWTMSTEEQLIMCTMAKLPGDVERLRRKQIYVLWKIVAAAYTVAGFVWDLVVYKHPYDEMFIYVTHCTRLFDIFYLVTSCYVAVKSLKHNVQQSHFCDERGRPHWFILCVWILHDIVLVCAPAVTLLFFALVYQKGQDMEVNAHILTTVAILPDWFFSQFPCRLLHVYVCVTYAMVYIVFSIIHYATNIGNTVNGTRYIYPALDWGDIPLAVTSCIKVVVAVICLHVLVLIASKVTISTRNKEEPDSHSGDVDEFELPPVKEV